MTHASRRPAQLAASYADHPIETTRRASLHNGLSPVRRHHLPALPADVFGPVVHEPPPPLEQVRPRVRRLDLVMHHVRERRFDHLAWVVGVLGGPIAKGGPEPVRHGRDLLVLEEAP